MSKASEFAEEYKKRAVHLKAAEKYMEDLVGAYGGIGGQWSRFMAASGETVGVVDGKGKLTIDGLHLSPSDALAFAAWIVEQFKD